MAYPTLTPASNSSKSILAATGTINNITTSSLPLGVYVNSEYWSATQINLFKQGAAEQVAFVYKRLGGDVLDIEIVESQVYAAYEEATLEYSYLVNLHQSKNVLSRMLGGTTGSFDSKGQLTGSVTTGAELKYPRWNLGYARTVAQGYSTIAGYNGTQTVYSGSFPISAGQQDYDLQAIISSSATAAGYDYSGKVGDKRINILKVYYKTVGASWNFYGYFGGLNVVGNLSTYGQYADDSTFEVIPAWQNKLQAMAYEDAIKTRVSDWSYELRNNKLRLYPVPNSSGPDIFWFLFTIPTDAWAEEGNTGADSTLNGVNNINTIPFENIAYDKINSMGKQWIRRYALALCKEMLGYIRSKFNSIPIPNESVTLNGTALVSEGKAEQKELKDELMKVLDETTYDKLLEKDSAISKTASEVQSYAPNLIYVG
jgi:hypothetical protein